MRIARSAEISLSGQGSGTVGRVRESDWPVERDAAMTEPTGDPRGPSFSATLGGGAWTVAERVISQASQLILFIAAARVLSPADFGVFALVSTAALLLLRMSEVGWAPYIMSWSGDDQVPRQVVGVAVLTGLVAGLAAAGASLSLQAFAVSQTVSHLLLWFSLWVVLATTSSAQKGMMIWRDGLKGSAIAESIGEVVGMLVALGALFAGAGVYALVFGRLSYQATHLTISFAVTRRAPLFGMERAELRRLGVYSAQIFSSRFVANLRLYVATFLIGGFLGAASVGYYRAAQRLVGSIGEIIGAPSQVLAWSMFRQARDAHGARSTGFQRQANLYFKLLFAVGIPVFIWLTLMGGDLIEGLLGHKWLPALPVVGVLALARALALPAAAVEPILSLSGEIRRLPIFSLAFLLLAVVLTAAGATFGLVAVAWSQVAVAGLSLLGSNWLLSRHGGIDWRQILREARQLVGPILLGSLVLLWAREAAPFQALPPLLRAIAVALPAGLVYGLGLTASDPWLRRFALSRLRRSDGI